MKFAQGQVWRLKTGHYILIHHVSTHPSGEYWVHYTYSDDDKKHEYTRSSLNTRDWKKVGR